MRRLLPLLLGACAPTGAEALFVQGVAPALERSCAATTCHGVGPGAEASGEVVDRSLLFFDVDEAGHLVDLDEARRVARRTIVTDEDPWFSVLVRKPLAAAYGGLPHAGGESWRTPDDPDLVAILAWIRAETDGGGNTAPLDALEQRFADDVQPVLVASSCMTGSCHGTGTSVPFRLDPGVGGAFPRAATRANYEAARTMLTLDGVADQTRLLRKGLPLHAGGIVHKGGNARFFDGPDDPRALAIERWACAERLEAIGLDCRPPMLPPADAVVFVRGPLGPEPLFALDAWAPGSDVWLAPLTDDRLTPGAPRNLTAGLHAAPADVREPSVSPDGTRIVFAMRTAPGQGHRLWELDLGTGESWALTDGPGGWSDRDPTYGPEGRVWFVSDRAGVIGDVAGAPDSDVYTVDPATRAVERRTFTPHAEREPVALYVGHEAGGKTAFTSLRAVHADQARAHPFRFPDGLETEYHQHFGITPVETLFHDMRELPDGRYVLTFGELDDPWGGTRLGVVDRNFGPELNARALFPNPAIPFYADPLTRLDPGADLGDATPGFWRDPVALPDGRLLVAWAPEAGADAVDTAIVVLTLAERPDGTGPRVVARKLLIDAPGLADHDPEPVFVRPEAPTSGVQRWDRAATTGTLRHQGLPMIDALLANLEPSGPKTPRDDIVAVRLVEAIPLAADRRAPLPDAGPRASTTSLAPYMPSRVLAELPIAADGSFHVDMPAGVAVRLQPLDARGLAVGHPHNRWFDVNPGQTIPQGVTAEDPAVYAALCAGCHGARDGDPDHAFVAPDVITTASLSLSRYEGCDPRRPLPPASTGAATRVEVDFARDVQPVLDRACVACHAALADGPGDPFTPAYEHLLASGWVEPGHARASRLVEALLGEELDAPAPLAGRTPHADLDDADLRTLTRWIDLGCGFVGTEAP